MIKQQTNKQKAWQDNQGMEVPFSRVTLVEKLKEKSAYSVATQAIKLNAQLSTFRQSIADACEEVYNQVMTAKERKQATKGNFTFYNFDGSIKVEVSVDDRLDFDSLLIEKCKLKLLSLVGDSISEDKAFIKELVLSAFQTKRGNLDTKKIMGLKRYAPRIKDARYQEAMTLLDESIRVAQSKKYYRVYLRGVDGEYNAIDLNFSSII
ncbi:DUF3164 family protein [Chitinophaga agrisoli]|uniref:DUF3164 family protein n=1 Tax=Chitinophaga agrisoli TaxID=2607653 RepID=A0A5B2W564_9BACT|nr:DUF3164 family protein [Chitinophaga agrisoli]KAA2245517.1 DUF3164 family protein [Chitinophaga agrisoli]